MKIDLLLNKDHEVQIGAHKLQIKFVPPSHPRLDEGYGVFSSADNCIYINKEEPETYQFSTYLHELIHAIEQIYTFELDHQLVNLLGEGLAQALLNTSEEKKEDRKKK